MIEKYLGRWFLKFTYKQYYVMAYILVVITALTTFSIVFATSKKSDVTQVSVEHFKSKFKERDSYIKEYFEPYFISLNALSQDALIKAYLDGNVPRETIEQLFMTVKKSLPCAFQVRHIGNDGRERIRIEGTPTILKNPYTHIVPSDELQDKSQRYYVREFAKLKRGQTGISAMDLNREQGKIDALRRPIIRFAVPLFDSQQVRQGILVYNICLKTFFANLDRTTLYHVHIIDGQGRYILNDHPDHGGITGDKFDTHTIVDDFGADHARSILSGDEYFGGTFYAHRTEYLPNAQDLRIIMELKFQSLSQESADTKTMFLIILIIISILLLPVIYLFASVPEAMKQRFKKDSYTDSVTGLPNSRQLYKDLNEHTFNDAIIVLIHIDNYATLKNIYGHDLINEMMLQLSRYIDALKLKRVMCLYRHREETLAMKYHFTHTQEAFEAFLDSFITLLQNNAFIIDSNLDLLLDITLGVSDPDKINNDLDELKEAEVALIEAIQQHREFVIYGEHHVERIEQNRENLEIAKIIKSAIDNRGVELHYQPILNLNSGQIEKYETLMRLRHGDRLWYPNSFLELSKTIKKYKKLTALMVDTAFAYFQDKPYEFSINLSIEDIQDQKFSNFLIRKMEEYGVGDRVVIEIVESESVDDYDLFFEFVKQVKSAGCKIAIDDFGSGYSNMQYLITMSRHLDYLKIDGSLIANILDDKRSQILVQSIIGFCQQMSLQTIAEFVENQKIADYLHSIGVDHLQGYHIGKPLPHLVGSADQG
jgi:EAL domain-containing protein (putative c-di-GMP-specific phosphodiesterase class I)/GGDEF domain-containing protein